MTPRAFLDLLWQYKPEELYILMWTLQDKRSHWFQDVAKAAEFAAAVKDRDVYVGVGLSKADHGPARRCTSEEIAGLGSMWTDLDLKSEAHQKPLPPTIPDALSIIPPAMPPSILVSTGNGVHPWWLLKEPAIFESDEERKDAARLASRWHTMLRLNSAARGWAYDRLSDLSRVLRIPGTLNHKDPANLKEVTVLSVTDRRYNLSDFEEFLDEAGIPDPEAEEKAAREWAERFADTPLVINTAARTPEDMLDGWMREDMRFRNTWLRQRHDLKDQSGSGYDLALACFGMDAGLSEQQIVDLIIHHRAHHGQRQRTRIDYFQRTIAKATQRVGGLAAPLQALSATPVSPTPGPPVGPAAPPPTGPAAPQGAPVAPEQEQAADSTSPPASNEPAAKALLCERISTVLGIRIVRIVKIEGKEPQYRMELAEGPKIEFPNVGKLITYDSVRVAIAAMVGRIIPKIKAKHWEQIAQAMLDACIVEPGTDEMEWEGAARMYLHHYLSETGFIPSIDSQRLQDQRRPMVLDGKVSVCTSELQTYVNKTTFQSLSVKAVAGMLSALGAKSIRVRGVKFKDQWRWVLPMSECDPDDYKPHEGGDHATTQ